MAKKHEPKNIYEYKITQTRVFIPKGVDKINDVTNDFEVEQVSEIIVEEGNPAFASADGVLFNKSMTTLLACPKGKKGNYVIPCGTVNIDNLSFDNCLGLTSVEIPSSVKTIGEWAFSGCKNLQSVTMHDGLEIIKYEAFKKCALKAVIVPKTVRIVEHEAFPGCPDITIFDSIDPSADMCCKHIDTLNGSPNSEVGFIGGRQGDYVITVLSAQTGQVKYKAWMDVASAQRSAQRSYYCLLTSAWGRNASFCFPALDSFFPKLKGVDLKLMVALRRMKYPYELPPEIREMYLAYVSRNAKIIIRSLIDGNDMETLLFCEALGIIRKDHVSEMIEYAISRENTLFTEYLQKYQLEKFGVSAVKPKTNTLKASAQETSRAGKDPLSPGEIRKNWAFENNADGTLTVTDYRGNESEIIIPARIGDAVVSRIASEAFSPFKLHRRTERRNFLMIITQVTLPDSILEIGDKAFYGCEALKLLNLQKTPAVLGRDVLTGCTKLYDKSGLLILNGYLYHSKAAGKRIGIAIPEGVHTILPYAFEEKRFPTPVSLSLPDTLKRIGDHAFQNVGHFAQIDLPEGLEEIGISAFSGCVVEDRRLVIPGSVRTVGDWAFHGCLLEEVWVKEGVQTIGINCFDGNRVTLHLPASLKSIGLIYSDNKQSVISLQVIHAPKASAAEAYASKYGFKFVEEAVAQPPTLRDTDYAADCAQRFAQLLSGLSTPPSLSINHGGLLQGITFLAAESLEVIRQLYEEVSQQIPRFVIDDTMEFMSEAGLRKLLASASRNNDGQLSLGKLQFVVDAFVNGSKVAYEPQIQLVAKNVSRSKVRLFWRIYQPESYYKSNRFHVLGQEMGKEE